MNLLNEIHNEDCLTGMARLPDRSVDMILCDLPYGRTKNKWDNIIPLSKLWDAYKRVIKPNGAIALFADGLFMADLMCSNRKMWRYNLVWDKALTTGFLNANRQPLRQHEEICIFYNRQPTYHPQKVKGSKNHSRGSLKNGVKNNNYGAYTPTDNSLTLGDMKHPTSIIRFPKPHPSTTVHPTEKPVELCEWLIRTYTDAGEIVLDNCAGSGSAIVACINTRRNFIGFEISAEYCELANQRIEDATEARTGALDEHGE